MPADHSGMGRSRRYSLVRLRLAMVSLAFAANFAAIDSRQDDTCDDAGKPERLAARIVKDRPIDSRPGVDAFRAVRPTA